MFGISILEIGVCMYMCVYIYMYIYMYMCIHVYKYTLSPRALVSMYKVVRSASPEFLFVHICMNKISSLDFSGNVSLSRSKRKPSMTWG